NVIFHGHADRKKVKEIFSNSFVGLITFLPSSNHINSSPNKMFEYMAAGLPVIASNFDTWKPLVEGNNLGITVNPQCVDEIYEAIVYLSNNKDIAKTMG